MLFRSGSRESCSGQTGALPFQLPLLSSNSRTALNPNSPEFPFPFLLQETLCWGRGEQTCGDKHSPCTVQQYVNCELPDVQVGFRKGRGTRDKLPTSAGSSKSQKSSRKISISALMTMSKPLTVWITINCGKF